MMMPQELIRRPLITEKSTRAEGGVEHDRASRSPASANKIEVKRAVETLFEVKVAEVRVANREGKVEAHGPVRRPRQDWKKAYVRLAAG